MLLHRILSALVLAPLIIAAVLYGSWPFYGLMAAVFVIGIHEWSRLSVRAGVVNWALMLAGVPYIALACLAAVWLRSFETGGVYLLFYVLFAVWACDIGAYAFGRAIGGVKLAPSISPNKTWAGMIGGALSAAIVLVAYDVWLDGRVFIANYQWYVHAALGVLLAFVGQGGDLLESAMKRRAGVKDSGHLIPGHGGILDRVDALLTTLPLFAVIVMVMGHA